ncbi:MAG: 4-phosphopantoate--beta-alanine ligase [Candidatus Woesearchaeota archaeon]|jgi:4-phosphopantoate--beta-alanine ligase|nr:4-phosphopantoate--beta-alanine ligase [Candidatus Woesearchaeota archaeon]
MTIPKTHPRYLSLKIRDKIVDGVKKGITSTHGLVAHGRGEAFDYLLGEKTTKVAKKSIDSAAALLLLAKNPVISVNGNAAALVARDLVQLSRAIPAKLEVNIFHSSKKRELKIQNELIKNGAKQVLLPQKNCKIKYLDSNRKYVNKEGIYKADVVFVPLEDGDRTEALIKNKKKVIVVDLNPMSRSAKKATITIVDNIIRVVPLLIKAVNQYKKFDKNRLENISKNYNNKKILNSMLREISRNLV